MPFPLWPLLSPAGRDALQSDPPKPIAKKVRDAITELATLLLPRKPGPSCSLALLRRLHPRGAQLAESALLIFPGAPDIRLKKICAGGGMTFALARVLQTMLVLFGLKHCVPVVFHLLSMLRRRPSRLGLLFQGSSRLNVVYLLPMMIQLLFIIFSTIRDTFLTLLLNPLFIFPKMTGLLMRSYFPCSYSQRRSRLICSLLPAKLVV